MAYGLNTNHPMIDISTQEAFLAEVDSKTTGSSGRRLHKDIRKSVDSIHYKLNIIRYHAGLIQNVSESNYLRHVNHHLYPEIMQIETKVEYQNRCTFLMQNDVEYRMFLTLFVESFAAASFSLFDVCAHLLKDMFDLPFVNSNGDSKNVSYANALQETKLSQGYSSLHTFLKQYKPGESNSVSWIKPLKEIRNRTTHRLITDVCRLPVQMEDGNLFYDPPKPQEFLLYDDIFGTGVTNEKLKVFVETSFNGIENFVEELYLRLTSEVSARLSLPL